ncbi:YceI family protein [Sanyastnella coralliicola]|uniref:YceI family protein n=1 Tax=Sanyastnella coralliicola TaxID=3069118 RepID=UPI0027BA05FA|nr:YceI family protein [Longitalea sp. SCSIO 12813]
MENTATATKWITDTAHSELQFKVKHLVITTVTGQFKTFNGTVNSESEDFNNAKVNIDVDLNSIYTNNDDRDNHLRSGDFFDVENHPKMTFANGVLAHDNGDYKLTGDLTIKGTTKPVTFDVDFNGVAKDPWGNMKAGFEFSTAINRKDFGLTWNATTEAGGLLVGEDVKIIGSVQLQAAAEE